MNRVRLFDGDRDGVDLGWPASTTWYRFLAKLHQGIARAERMAYDDKDIMLVTSIKFFNGDNGYQKPEEMVVRFVRFNERSNDATGYDIVNSVENPPASRHYHIKLEMMGHIVTAFAYERVS